MLHFYWNAVLKEEMFPNIKDIPQYISVSEGTQNSFGLVQEQDKLKNLKRFELICADDGLAHLAVNLETGEFEIRGAVFHPYISLSPYNSELHYRVVFYRRGRGHLGTGMQPVGEQYIHCFLIGWQCTYNDLNYQRIMFYDPKSGGIEIRAKR